MPDKEKKHKQVNEYDKIIRENLENTLPIIIRDILGLDIALSEEIPDDIQHTKERKPDALKRVTDISGNKYILHLEFQVPSAKKMVFRMAEYNIMLLRKYELPIKQYVIFLKDGPPMPTSINTPNLKYHYKLIRISEIDYKLFLRSKNPEVKMLGILANFGEEDAGTVIQTIVEQVRDATEDDFDKNRYFQQLRIFAQLRNSIEQQFKQTMQSVSTFFKVENDVFYRQGVEEGVEKGFKQERAKAQEEKKQLALEMKEAGEPNEKIVRYTKLTPEVIEAL